MAKRPNILLVEDRKVVRKTISRILSKLDYNLVEANSGESALEELRQSDFDAIILDLGLPGISGMQMLEEAQSICDPVPPVVVLTEHDGYNEAFAAGKLQVFSFVSKGNLTPEKFKETIISAVKRKREFTLIKGGTCFKHNPFGCNISFSVQKNLVFVGIPFNMRKAYTEGIKPVVEMFKLNCCRADEVRLTVDYSCKICAIIQTSQLAIFDISSLSPNVLLELGFAYAAGKNVIILKHKKARTPSNLLGLAPVEYTDVASLREELGKYIKAFMSNRSGKSAH